jgi:hypothetical protein
VGSTSSSSRKRSSLSSMIDACVINGQIFMA